MTEPRIKQHIAGNLPMYLMGLLVIASQSWSILYDGAAVVTTIATTQEVRTIVVQEISAHQAGEAHAASEKAIEILTQGQAGIRGELISAKIDRQWKVICENPALRSQLINNVRTMEFQYKQITGDIYNRPACIDLGIVG